MRIVGGRHRGRQLIAPAGDTARPTLDRVRENLFNILLQGDATKGALPGGSARLLVGGQVLDAFAGTGALGLEALSRGAAQVSFIEQAPESLKALRTNIRALGEERNAKVLAADALNPPRAEAPCSLILLDAPYNKGLTEPAIAALDQAGWIAPTALIATETLAKEEPATPAGFERLDSRKYGKARITFFLRTGETG